MSRSVAPVNVSPVIKAFRWTFLILGVFYGTNKWNYLKSYEAKVAQKRKLEIKARHEKMKAEEKRNAREELLQLGKDMEITDFPPGWDNDL